MRVFKFGGSSVGDAKRIRAVVDIIIQSQKAHGQVVVVASAMQDVTNQLIEAGRKAFRGDRSYAELLGDLEARHRSVADELLETEKDSPAHEFITQAFLELREFVHGIWILGEITNRTLDFVMSYGEQLCCNILAEALRHAGAPSDYVDSRHLIQTDLTYGAAQVNFDLTNWNILNHFKNRTNIQVITGFIAQGPENETTTLGRGGSDYTASIIGAALDADEIEIWTDVDGVMTADPRKVSEAFSLEALSFEDGLANIVSDAAIHCVLLNWNLGKDDTKSHHHASELLRTIRSRNGKVPIFLMADRKIAATITLETAGLADEFVWTLEDTADFIAGRALAAMERYYDHLLPPFAAALMKYNREQEYSWAAPGHQGGVAFTKSPVGRVFFDFYGENLFRTDMGIERASLGSLLDHTGPIGESEKNTARVFGAHRSYSVLNGTSGSNRAIMQACIGDDEIALCDRNCHKSIEQGLAITGGIPVFFAPSRNRYGIIGPIHPKEFAPESIAAKIAGNPLAKKASSQRAVS